ncbi:hypothetical protein [Novosphingobium sp.]
MAKSQKRSTREIRKPKAAKAKPINALPPGESGVQAAIRTNTKGKV